MVQCIGAMNAQAAARGHWVDTREGIPEKWAELADEVDATPGITLADYFALMGWALSEFEPYKAEKGW